jgi:hypothetical protein
LTTGTTYHANGWCFILFIVHRFEHLVQRERVVLARNKYGMNKHRKMRKEKEVERKYGEKEDSKNQNAEKEEENERKIRKMKEKSLIFR